MMEFDPASMRARVQRWFSAIFPGVARKNKHTRYLHRVFAQTASQLQVVCVVLAMVCLID